MQVTTSHLKLWFDELNKSLFGGELPVPALKTGNARTTLGTMCRKTVSKGLFRRHTEYTIRISNYYERTEDEFKNVLLHEMIHYYIAFKGLRDTSAHGRLFRRMMADVNARGWHVSISERGKMQVAERKTRRRKAFLLLALITTDGKKLITVVSEGCVLKIHLTLISHKKINSWQWYRSTDERLASWPKVRTLRARIVSDDEFRSLTSGAERVNVCF